MADETDGTWQPAEAVPGSISLNTGGAASVSSISCTAPGACTAGGQFTTDGAVPAGGLSVTETFVADESDGQWGNAAEVPGSAKLNMADSAGVGRYHLIASYQGTASFAMSASAARILTIVK